MEQMKREQLAVQQERAILVACLLPDDGADPHDPLAELRSLADTAGAVCCDQLMQKRAKPDAATFIGKGKVEELRMMCEAHKAQVVIFDNDLSPSQIGNIEEVVERKVIDRSELILDIFAARARTHEARLQVELAHGIPRTRVCVRCGATGRIVGGAPAGIGTRGPGEQQLEIDRRIVQRKKAQLKREIKEVQGRKQREVSARNQDFFTVCLVGYTNAGKSTLFNTAIHAASGQEGGAYADDKLFATLSTRTRKWDLGGGDTVMLSDTVGFVRNLPHHLVASFKATLEEAIHADLLLVVLDVSHPRAEQQYRTVMEVLDDIGATEPKRLLLLNKTDLLTHNADLLVIQQEHPGSLPISAKTHEGLSTVIEAVRGEARGGTLDLDLQLSSADGKAIHFLENRANVLERNYEGSKVTLSVRIGRRQLDQLYAMGSSAVIVGEVEDDKPKGGWGR
ncbi:MAG: GTPase HflX [Phycisphaerales bacterium]